MAEEKAKTVGQLKEELAKIQEKISQVDSDLIGVDNKSPLEEVKELLVWRSPARVFVARDKKWFTNVFLIVLILSVILVFMREFITISVLLAITFLSYVLATVPPDEIEHKITNKGVTTAGHSYFWEELRDFWFSKKYGRDIVNIDTKKGFPGRLIILLQGHSQEKVKEILSKYLTFQEKPELSWMEKTTEKFTSRLS